MSARSRLLRRAPRGAALAALALVVACTALADLDRVDAPRSADGGSSSGADGGEGGTAATPAADGGQTSLKELDASCEQRSDCLSGNCNEVHRCVETCKGDGDECSVSANDCCSQLSCQTFLGSRCTKCLDDGALLLTQPESLCCSKRARAGKCASVR